MERRIDLRQLVAVFSLFLLAQFAGLLLTYVGIPPQSVPGLLSQASQQQSQQASVYTYLWILILEVIAVAAVLVFVVRSYKGRNFFVIAEAYIVLLGGFFFFLLLLGDIAPYANTWLITAASAACAVALYAAKRSKKLNVLAYRNIVTIISSIGVGAFLGLNLGAQFGVLALYAILGIFAVYDYLAVFVLKFMIPLARQAASMNLAFMIGSSELELHPGSTFKYTKEDLGSIKDRKLRSLISSGNAPAVSNVMLGNGDIMLPMAVAVGSYAYTASISLAMTIALGASIGLMATFWVLRRYKAGLPAIPPIFAFVSLALAVFYISAGISDTGALMIFIAGAVLSLAAMYLAVRRISSAKAEERGQAKPRPLGRKSR